MFIAYTEKNLTAGKTNLTNLLQKGLLYDI